ncbi:indolepyruvate ferredoxin oxidoreductase [Dysgonomonadaceae bacterium zrk40]|nr:indolepyruvate ferredoxin oxidoreductase [Dysgonomonadaceae bacterium zrk40]
MEKKLLLGAEAVAQGAIDAGISGVYAYPGTPSTEITEYIQRATEGNQASVHSRWATNEKTAFEAALGVSYSGRRSLVCMKHVGLNVAADAFMNAAITGVLGGLVLVVADDPSMHSSQNEQDSRYYGRFAMIPILEPSNQQEAYEMVSYGFEFSEILRLPVMLRITTRLSHSRAVVTPAEPRAQNKLNPERDRNKWILLPANARKNYHLLLTKQDALRQISEQSPYNRMISGSGERAVIAFGIAVNYAMEVITSHNLEIPLLRISQYPLPEKMVKQFTAQYSEILIAEEGYPLQEELLRGFSGDNRFRGRLDGTLPRTGELSPALLEKALLEFMGCANDTRHDTKQPAVIYQPVTYPLVVPRPPMLCKGCSHRDLFEAINRVMNDYPEKHVFGDIGCYTLGALPPYSTISSCVDMGASITMAKGAADAGLRPALCVIGDSTFTHSGITGLLDAVNDRSPLTVIISDNGTTAMTGGQDSAGTGRFFDICKGVGVDEAHIRSIVPLRKNMEENITIIREELEYEGVSVIIAQRECIHIRKTKNR